MAQGSPGLSEVLGCLKRLDGKTRLIVTRSGTVVASAANEPLLEADGDGVLDALRYGNHGQDTRQGKIARLLAVRGNDVEVAIIETGHDGRAVLVRAIAVDEEHVCLALTVPGQPGSPRIGELQQLFGLTAAEARIVLDLMEGQPPQAIAKRRSNSIHTIRAHIRQCHQKIGVRSREELFSRISEICL